jgi:hypothetical protein
VNFNVNFNIVFTDNSLVHQLVNKQNFNNIKMDGTNVKKKTEKICVTSGFCREVDENRALFGHYAAE